MGGRGSWGLSPLGWALAYLAVAAELAGVVGLWRPLGTLGVIHVPASAVPAFLLLVVFGARLVPAARSWAPFLLWAAVVAAVPAWCFRDLFGGFDGFSGFVVAAVHEEVVFRAAFPVVVWRILDGTGIVPAWSRMGAILLPAAVFAVLPNHLFQAAGAVGVLPFFTFALFFGLLVRSPSFILPAALAHLSVNLLTVPVTHGFVSPGARAVA
ncbi:MAG TPA: CPBP family glutamic-type intramembrane protease, partial [Acidimicrobiia bacterium]|nr:CPBP family glutamic-type intramembrane protease [Acidimicrobiia bacterium]